LVWNLVGVESLRKLLHTQGDSFRMAVRELDGVRYYDCQRVGSGMFGSLESFTLAFDMKLTPHVLRLYNAKKKLKGELTPQQLVCLEETLSARSPQHALRSLVIVYRDFGSRVDLKKQTFLFETQDGRGDFVEEIVEFQPGIPVGRLGGDIGSYMPTASAAARAGFNSAAASATVPAVLGQWIALQENQYGYCEERLVSVAPDGRSVTLKDKVRLKRASIKDTGSE
jgi:hypothetical protein